QLDALAKANRLVADGQVDMEEGRWQKAESRFAEALRLRADLPQLWTARAELYGQLGLWDLAAPDYAKARGLRGSANSNEWHNYALTQLAAGDKEGYRATCKRMAEAFRYTKDEDVSSMIGLTCALVPDPVLAPARLVAIASAKAGKSNRDMDHWR